MDGGINTYDYVNGRPFEEHDFFGLAPGLNNAGGSGGGGKGVASGVNANFGNGWIGRIDSVPGTNKFEIHIFNKAGKEVGMYNEAGWFNKHGHQGSPSNIPKGVEEQIQGRAINELRRRAIIPPKGEANIKNGNWKKIAKACRAKGGAPGVVAGVAIGMIMGDAWSEMAEDSVCGIFFGCEEAN